MKPRNRKPLLPPDAKRCQAILPPDSWMRFANRPARQCESVPTVIATESKAGKDGRKGSMSLCDSCKQVMVKQCGADFATFRLITKRKATERRNYATR